MANMSWREQCHKALRETCDVQDGALEYIREAEHMDGYGYWDNFTTLDEVLADFDLYLQSR